MTEENEKVLFFPEEFSVKSATIMCSRVVRENELQLIIDYDDDGLSHFYHWNDNVNFSSDVAKLLKIFDVSALDELIGKKVYAISNDECFFAMYSPENGQTFCSPISLYPDQYIIVMTNLLEKDNSIDLSHLTKEQAILYSFLYSIPVSNDLSKEIHNYVRSQMQYSKLQLELVHRSQNIPKRKKKI